MKVFDTHCHLAGSELSGSAEDIASRAIANGVGGMAIIAADEASLKSSQDLAAELSKKFPQVHIVASAGIHPHDAKNLSDELWQQVLECAKTAVAIGETGLDYHYLNSDRETQISVFERHIELACDLKKPLVIHCREAAEDILHSIKSSKRLKEHPNPGILHCFTESADIAAQLVDLGFYISFSGILTFKNANSLREIAKTLPLDRILIETDSPWLAPMPNRGKVNEPAFVTHVFNELSKLRSEDPSVLEQKLWDNSCSVFGLKV